MGKSILEIKDVSKDFGDGSSTIRVLKNINLTVKQGEFIAIVGPSGSGKSTLLSVIGALLSPTEGEIMIDHEVIQLQSKKRLSQLRAKKIGFIFQAANLIPYLNVSSQLKLVNQIANNSKGTGEKRAQELLSRLDLHQRVNNFPSELSGGEKQRVAIARAFMNDPSIILADEPTASLDSVRGRKVVEMISQEVKSRNKAAIMVTHDERMLDLCDKVYVMKDGCLSQG
ncbi:ABC transporter ATP-binding protein [Halalkalibacter okhensis]|uniref:Putative hemin import ATP-binding protein HrtA n=1 Tax=Halalkalibacter okhensis TaxID=333138 RepID=A0A0B0IDC2_9BACI|nr:ABC transporter ATP-binding protein [Halalkalibacter okhensis]KHF39285.1 hemin ABC transporter ATP-binding protein [Halalkalibacter okhensis]